MSDETRDPEQNEELEEQDEVEAHARFDASSEPDDDFEAHIKLN